MSFNSTWRSSFSGSPAHHHSCPQWLSGSHPQRVLQVAIRGSSWSYIPLENISKEGDVRADAEAVQKDTLFRVYVLFALGGQALMSFDGGATQMSQTALLKSGWSQSMLGVLGAMDKFGQTLCAPLWGPLLHSSAVKWLVASGLLLKALSCAGFGLLVSQPLMLASKFGMGAFEALVGIWAVGWIDSNASSSEARGKWQGSLSIAAGIGNGVGSVVAGIGATHLGYSFAFLLQAALLLFLSVGMVLTPSDLLGNERVEVSSKPFNAEVETILGNGLWLCTVLANCFNIFVQTGIGYMWQTTTQYVWAFSDLDAVASLLLVTGLGGLVGTQKGPEMIKKYVGAFQGDIRAIERCLGFFTKVTLAIGICGTACAALLIQKVWHIVDTDIPQQAWGSLLASFVLFLFVIIVLLQSMAGTLTSIMIDEAVVPSHTKSIAIGLSQAIQNTVGYAGGMVLPTLLAGHVRHALDPSRPIDVIFGASAATGMALTLGSGWVLHLIMSLAARSAAKM